jgi:hypothetical protein
VNARFLLHADTHLNIFANNDTVICSLLLTVVATCQTEQEGWDSPSGESLKRIYLRFWTVCLSTQSECPEEGTGALITSPGDDTH